MTNNKYKIHFIGLSHLPCDPQYTACGFTMKNYKFCKMMMDLGHELIYYGCEGSTVPCTKHVVTHTLRDLRNDYGDGDNRFDIGYDFTAGDFRQDFGAETKKTSTQKLYAKSIEVINATKKPDDFLMLSMGWYHKPIHDATNLFLTCEPGVGYKGNYCGGRGYGGFRAFESHFMRSYMLGVESQNADVDGTGLDRVIPNFFEDDAFEFSAEKQDYVLYIGRLTVRKGVVTAYNIAKEAGIKLLITGQGGKINADGSFISRSEPRVTFPAGNWEYVGYSGKEQRKQLLKNAKAILVPTSYLEPFAGVHIEAMLSGTPPITSGYAAFGGDLGVPGVHYMKCDFFDDFVNALKNIEKLDPYKIRKCGERYLMSNVKWEFQRWMDDLQEYYLGTIQPNSGHGWWYQRAEEPEWRKNIKTILG